MRSGQNSSAIVRHIRNALVSVSVLGTIGCASFVDKVTSKDFRVRDLVSTPDPLTELRQNQDGDARAQAMRALKEPSKNGRSPDEQDESLRYLSQAATSDSRPLCRLAAIEALGRFEDPRAVDPLLHAYHQADALMPDIANAVRSEIMTALGKKTSPEALGLLAKVAGVPPKPSSGGTTLQTSFTEGETAPAQETVVDRDLRIAAIRALGASKDRSAIPVLLTLLSEKDVALRNRANDALLAITGKTDIPPDPVVWKKILGISDGPPRGQENAPRP